MFTFEHEWSPPLFSKAEQETEPEKCRSTFSKLKLHLQEAWKNREKIDYFRDNEQESESGGYVEFNDTEYKIKARHYVGYISVDGISLTILPKYLKSQSKSDTNTEEIEKRGLRELLYILKYAFKLDSSYKELASIGHDINQEILDFFIRVFSVDAYSKLKRHQYRKYENITENLPQIKGKILFTDHLKANIVKSRLDRVYCGYEIFTEDNGFNRLVKYVCRKLIILTKDERNKKNLRGILNILVDVEDEIVTKAQADRVFLSRLEQDLKPILNWCKIFLNKGLIYPRAKKTEVHSILIDMNRVFEVFIAKFLQKHLPQYHFTPQSSGDYLASTGNGDNIFRMNYDILGKLNEKEFIIDTKNKITNFSAPDSKGGISQNDLYQMATYAIRRKCKNILLIYPKQINDTGLDTLNYYVTDKFDESIEPIEIKCGQVVIGEHENEEWQLRDERLKIFFEKILKL